MDDRFDQPAVHYVTGGMWQIVPSIQQFLQQFNYPPGAFAVNRIDLNSLGAIWKTMRRYSNMGRSKLVYIRSLLDRFPERRFILVGDTVLMDPEMLADLVKDYPVERVPHVFIRRVKRSITVAFKPQPEEYFRGLDPSRWTLFTNASELAAFNMRNYLNGFYK
jgi:phosphatidate phosphatase APP1